MVRHRSQNNAKQTLRSQNRTRIRKTIPSSRLLSFTFSRFLLYFLLLSVDLCRDALSVDLA